MAGFYKSFEFAGWASYCLDLSTPTHSRPYFIPLYSFRVFLYMLTSRVNTASTISHLLQALSPTFSRHHLPPPPGIISHLFQASSPTSSRHHLPPPPGIISHLLQASSPTSSRHHLQPPPGIISHLLQALSPTSSRHHLPPPPGTISHLIQALSPTSYAALTINFSAHSFAVCSRPCIRSPICRRD